MTSLHTSCHQGRSHQQAGLDLVMRRAGNILFFSKRRGGHLKKATRELKTKYCWLTPPPKHRPVVPHVIHIEFKFQLSPVFHKGKLHCEAQNRSTRPRNSNNRKKKGSSNSEPPQNLSQTNTRTYTRTWGETETQRQVLKAELFEKKSLFFFYPTAWTNKFLAFIHI